MDIEGNSDTLPDIKLDPNASLLYQCAVVEAEDELRKKGIGLDRQQLDTILRHVRAVRQ